MTSSPNALALFSDTHEKTAIMLDDNTCFYSTKQLKQIMERQYTLLTLLCSIMGSMRLLFAIINSLHQLELTLIEQRREIGIRLALGSPEQEVQWLWLTEIILLSIVNGTKGVAGGTIGCLIIAGWTQSLFTACLLMPLFGCLLGILIGMFLMDIKSKAN